MNGMLIGHGRATPRASPLYFRAQSQHWVLARLFQSGEIIVDLREEFADGTPLATIVDRPDQRATRVAERQGAVGMAQHRIAIEAHPSEALRHRGPYGGRFQFRASPAGSP